MKRVSTADFRAKKLAGQKISMLTAYDFVTASLVEEAGLDAILVGDSLGNVILGYDSTIPVTLDDMVHHCRAVARACRRAMIIGDMPFLSYHTGHADTLRNAGRLLQEGGAHAVKLEGGQERAETVRLLVEAGIPVMGHLGLTPQSIYQLGSYQVQGKSPATAEKLRNDAQALEQAGAFALVLECVPGSLAATISRELQIPTIGIGAGAHCDGQVLVSQDLLGLSPRVPRFVKQYASLRQQMLTAFRTYKEEVEDGRFPGSEHSY